MHVEQMGTGVGRGANSEIYTTLSSLFNMCTDSLVSICVCLYSKCYYFFLIVLHAYHILYNMKTQNVFYIYACTQNRITNAAVRIYWYNNIQAEQKKVELGNTTTGIRLPCHQQNRKGPNMSHFAD